MSWGRWASAVKLQARPGWCPVLQTMGRASSLVNCRLQLTTKCYSTVPPIFCHTSTIRIQPSQVICKSLSLQALYSILIKTATIVTTSIRPSSVLCNATCKSKLALTPSSSITHYHVLAGRCFQPKSGFSEGSDTASNDDLLTGTSKLSKVSYPASTKNNPVFASHL